MIRLIFLFVLLFVFAGCQPVNQEYDKPYFDFDSLIIAQERALVATHSTLNKKVMLNGQGDTSSRLLDSVTVAYELDVFRQLDLINKPLYTKAYKITDGKKDSQSNLIKREYIALTPSPIPVVTFYYQGSFDQLKKIESLYTENNSLYATQRKLILEFENSSGKLLLSRYVLTGDQKMILSDSVQFSIEGILH